MMGIYTLFKAR